MRSLGGLGARGVLGLFGSCTFMLWACNGIVGIETLHEGPNPNGGGAAGAAGAAAKGGGAGTATSAGAGGKANTGGGSSSQGGASATSGGSLGSGGDVVDAGAGGIEGGAGGVPSQGGTAGTSTGSGGSTAGRGGAGGAGGVTAAGGSGGVAPSNGGSAGSAGSGGTTTGPGTVSGTVIDVWGHPVSGVAVTIGTAAAATNATGKFSITNVAATYDVALSLHVPVGGGTGNYAYVYQGLTRRDPTLQVYRALTDQSADPVITPSGTNAMNQNMFAFGSAADGQSHRSFDGAVEALSGVGWYGPAQTTGAYHVLSWREDANGAPTGYYTYLTAALNPTANTKIPINLTLTNNLMAGSPVSGSVTSPTANDRTNYLFARFKDNAVVPIADVTPSAAAFTFATPALSDADITVAASEGADSWYGPYAVAYKTVAPGATGVALTIPSPATSVAPASGRTGVDGNTQFQWAGDDSVVVLHVESVPRYQGMYIITTAKSLKLPDVGGGFFLVKGEEHWWQVEAHGSYTSVDQVAKAGGFISTFAADRTEPRYYKAADQGYFSASDALGFTTAP